MTTKNEITHPKESVYWPVFFPKKFVKRAKGRNGYFWIISFNTSEGQKEVYFPHSFLREDKYRKGYIGKIKVDNWWKGSKKVKINIHSSEFLKYFPPKRIPRS